MPDLASIIASSAKDSLSIAQGVVGRKDSELYVAVDGSRLSATWLDNVTVEAGDKILALISQPKTGTGTAIVIGRLTNKPRQLYAKVTQIPITGATIKVQTDDGEEFDAIWTNAKPAVGSIVALLWQGNTPVVLGVRGGASKPADVDVTKPTTPVVKQEKYVKAVDSGTYTPRQGGWNSYYKSKTYVGTWQVYTCQGVFFYGSGLAQLKDCSRIQFYLPARTRAGRHSASANIVLDLVSQSAKTGSPQFLGADFSITVSPGWSGGWITLPDAWLSRIGSAGGIGLKSGDYAGFVGVYDNAASGQVWGK